MELQEALRILAEHKQELTARGAGSVAIFGSVARNEAGPDSDVDILVELNQPMGLFGFAELKEYLESILGQRVDLVTPDGLKARIRDRILSEAVRAA
ncbi:MAG TPA: nucleotidyltransferase family protein [Chloroflexota bacterium]|nr:nucleotidyltransferase family protein [Chloroflexota bacterium]